MYKIFTTACILPTLIFTSLLSFAQHRATLWGIAEKGGPKDAGYIFKYNVPANTFTKEAWLNKPYADPTYFTEVFKADSNYLYAIKGQNDSMDKATIVRWHRKTGQLEKLYTFDPERYKMVSGSLTELFGKYYGVAYSAQTGPYTFYNGVIFEYNPATNVVANEYYFSNATNGRYPRGQLFALNYKLYGTTTYGGVNDAGVLFEFDPVYNIMVKKADFSAAVTGSSPNSFLQLVDGKFYGICTLGGAFSKGTLFEYDLTSGLLRKVHDFTGKTVEGKPVLHNSKLYIPQSDSLNILEYNLATGTHSTYRPIIGNTFPFPASPLYLHNGVMYGVSNATLWEDSSYVYRWTPGSGVATKIAQFNIGKEGKNVNGPLTMVNDKLYAITERGGHSGRGSLVEIDPLAKNATVKASFGSGVDGYSEQYTGSNLLYMNNRFYATTFKGGHYGHGLLFSYDPATQTVDRLHDFDGAAESVTYSPYGHLTSPGDREIHGLILTGAYNNNYGLHYSYLISDRKLQLHGTLNEYNPLYFEHGIQQSYMAYSMRVYKAKAAEGAEPAGIFMSYPNSPNFTRVFTFPIPIRINWEKGLTVLNNTLLGLGRMIVNNVDYEVIYKYDLVTGQFAYKLLNNTAMMSPIGLTGYPVELNNKLYVLSGTGCNNYGSLIEWDNTADTAIQYCLDAYIINGRILGSLTAAEGKLYGYSENGIVCFDPVAKTFRLVQKAPTPMFGIASYSEYKKLTITYSNASPQISAVDSIPICLDDSLTRHIALTVSDADLDTVRVTASYTDSALIRSCRIQVDTNSNGSLKYTLHVETQRTTGTATILIKAEDSYAGSSSIPVTLTVARRAAVSITFNTDTICKNDTSVVITGGRPGGGLYLVDGQPIDTTKAGLLAIGTHVLKYIYTNAAGCSDSASRSFYIAACAVPDTTSQPSSALIPYPNPSPGYVRIENSEQLYTTVHVFNAQGFKVYTKVSADNVIVLDLYHLKTGIYYINTINSKGVAAGKVEIVK